MAAGALGVKRSQQYLIVGFFVLPLNVLIFLVLSFSQLNLVGCRVACLVRIQWGLTGHNY